VRPPLLDKASGLSSVTDAVSVSDNRIADRADARVLRLDQVISANVTATDADVSSYFDAHTADFKISRKRKVKLSPD